MGRSTAAQTRSLRSSAMRGRSESAASSRARRASISTLARLEVGLPDLEPPRDAAEPIVVAPATDPAVAEGRPDHLLEVGARAERLLASAREDGNPGGVVVAEARPGLDERLVGVRVDGVHRVRPVDGAGDDATG